MTQPATNHSNIVQLARLRRIAQNNPQQQPKPKILFVDDEERILNSLRALFRLQYDVTVSTDGYHALELLKRQHYHLLVSDQRMPTMQGVELLRLARESSPNTVRILLTGFSDLAAIVGSVNDGEVYRYINKPWDSEELGEIIAGAVKVGLDLEKLETAKDAQPISQLSDSDNAPSAIVNVENITAKNVTPTPAANDTDDLQAGLRTSNFASDSNRQRNPPHPQPESKPKQTPLTHPHPTADYAKINGTLLFLDHSGELQNTFKECGMRRCKSLHARSPEEALQLMEKREVAVITASIDGVDRANVGFLCLLKKEHPEVMAIAVARLGDSETIIGLVNSARIFRVIFHPLRPKVLRHHLVVALKQVDSYRAQPELLKVQQAKTVAADSSLMTGIGSLLKKRMRSIRSFFRRQ